jgi:hypothetical protein
VGVNECRVSVLCTEPSERGSFCEDSGNLVRSSQVESRVSLICEKVGVCPHGQEVRNNGNVPTAGGGVKSCAPGVGGLVHVYLARLREELDVSEGAFLHCLVERGLTTVEVLQTETSVVGKHVYTKQQRVYT